MVNLKINDIDVSVPDGTSILKAAEKLNIKIPRLCYHEDLCIEGSCRVCVVEVKGYRGLVASCATTVSKGMEVITNSLNVRTVRKHIIELLLSEHNSDCTKCYKNGSCELQVLAKEYAVGTPLFIDLVPKQNYTIDSSSPSIIKDDSKCIKCRRCVRTCEELQGVSAIGVAYKGADSKISTFLGKPIATVICTNCGQCVSHCPTGALIEKSSIAQVWNALLDTSKHVVVQTAPAVRIALGEELGFPPGERITGKLVTSLKMLGFDSVLDTNFSADLTIMEEGTELLTRLKKAIAEKDTQVKLPMFTSCSPGWIKFIEHMFPEYLGGLSTCKSPQQMFGALAKTYYAQKRGINPEDIVTVSVMPCTAKKFEADRPEMYSSGYKDVDYVLTTRELACMIKEAGIDFMKLPGNHYDSIMGRSTGAAVIFGTTGGVMEAALRTVYEIVTGKEIPFKDLNIEPVRGVEGIRSATVKIENCLPGWKFLEGVKLKCAVAHGLVNAKELINLVKSGKEFYHFIEIMACPGGCLGGGGQPIPISAEIRKKRTKAIYEEDMSMEFRKSHENPEILQLYSEFLEKPNSHKAHELLHTHYIKR